MADPSRVRVTDSPKSSGGSVVVRRKTKVTRIQKQNKKSEFLSYKPRPPDLRYVDTVSEELLKSLSPEERNRQEVIFELINTEQLYFRDLKVMTDFFLRPIKEGNFLTAEEKTTLFGNLEDLVAVSERFMRALLLLQQKDSIVEKIGGTILEHVDILKPAFVEYCSKQSVVIEFLHELEEKNLEFKDFLIKRASKSVCRGLSLGSFLVAPFQRLCKYPLLIKEIRKLTHAGHEDSLNLEVAEEKMKNILDETNARATKVDEAFKLQQLFKKVDKKYSELLETCQLEIDDEITVEDSDGVVQNVYVILLDTCLLITKFKREAIQVRKKVDLLNLQLFDDPDEKPNELSLSLCGDSHQFIFRNAEQKLKWKERMHNLHAKLEIEMLKKRIARVKRTTTPPDVPDLIDPCDELGLLENENQIIANQMHEIVQQSVAPPRSTVEVKSIPIENPQLRPKSKAFKTRLKLMLESTNEEEEANSNSDTSTMMDEDMSSYFKSFRSGYRPSISQSSSQLVILFHGPPFSGKTTIVRELISICSNEHQLRCALFHENQAVSILQPKYGEHERENNVPILCNASSLLGNVICSLVNTESVTPPFDLIFVDGTFKYESQICNLLKSFEEINLPCIVCCCHASAATRSARCHQKESSSIVFKDSINDSLSIPGALTICGTSPISKSVTKILHHIMAHYKS